VDDEFGKERSRILSNVEIQLEERRREEGSLERALKSLSDSKILLERIEEEHSTSAREMQGRKNSEIKRLSGNVDSLRGELNGIAEMKTGIFRGISKKAKAEKEAEATERLNAAQKELASAEEHFTAEQERLRNEYERRKQPVIERIEGLQKEIDSLEIDGSLEVRRAACEALVSAVNALLQRNGLSLDSTAS
jgi:chromosome segregation ATPase